MQELSGGERSFTQVSLLLALGSSTECPFRIMDEFDVFMDSQNRSMAVELLVEAAKKNCRKQFIFVTPNYLSRSGGEGPEVGSSERSSRIDR
ncbi:hypothetical protein PI124_g12693 [Phytophthora idaei]|nr:hypothetical protein PI125_g15712 [Phytophthora idaei]KAG3152698.1 hypothetical protein PI126_g10406 [Phytophthora idaei]KAG3242470.1 hypothetical protein PI124_g12693 [Phytophthora idaei]